MNNKPETDATDKNEIATPQGTEPVAARDDAEETIVLGRLLGSHIGWDEIDSLDMVFYQFEPLPSSRGGTGKLVKGDLNINFETGHWAVQDADDDVVASGDLIELLRSVDRHEG